MITLETLKDFHRRKLQVLGESGADIIAFETIPSKLEAQVLIDFDVVSFFWWGVLIRFEVIFLGIC